MAMAERSIIELIIQVESGRQRLVEMAKLYGLNDPLVIEESQRLDKLILELQRRRESWT